MKKRLYAFITAIIGVIVLVVTATYLATVEKNKEEKYMIVERNIIDSAINCSFDEVCEYKDIVTLKELYENNYIKEQIDPKTNEYFDTTSYVDLTKKEFVKK